MSRDAVHKRTALRGAFMRRPEASGLQSIVRLSMNLLFALTEYHVLRLATVTIQFANWRMDRCRP
jgi:hypothetical protein